MANRTKDCFKMQSTEWQGLSCTYCGRPERGGISRLAILIMLLSFLALTGSCIVLFMYMREEARNISCSNNLKQIWLALQCYHVANNAFPPAYLCDKTGKPVNSWRTPIVPYGLSYNFPRAYDFAKPWDGPENSVKSWCVPENSRRLLREVAPRQFQCPSAGSQEPAITNYVAVVGPNTMWPGREAAKQAADGSDKDKILVIEVVNSDIPWMEPRDLTLEQALDAIQPKKGMGIGSRHWDGIHYVTVGGEVRTLAPNIDRESLRKLLVRDSHEPP